MAFVAVVVAFVGGFLLGDRYASNTIVSALVTKVYNLEAAIKAKL